MIERMQLEYEHCMIPTHVNDNPSLTRYGGMHLNINL